MDLSNICDNRVEGRVISTLIYNPTFIFNSPFLKERHFYNTDNSCIYWAIGQLVQQGITTITALNLEQAISSNAAVRRKIDEFNLPKMQEYIDLCQESKTDSVNEYILLAKKVVEYAFKRDLIKKSDTWQRRCESPDIDLTQISNDVYRDLNNLTSSYLLEKETRMIGEEVDNIYEKIKEKKARGESYGLPSFFPALGEFFSYEPAELIMFSARMKKGKSWLAMIEALHKAENGCCVLVCDTEMSDEQWYVRAVSYMTGIKVNRIKNDILTDEEEQLIADCNGKLKTYKLYHVYMPVFSKEKFYSMVAQLKMSTGLQFVVFDYIKADDAILDSAARSAYMGGMTNFLKNNIAGELNLPVLAFCQLGRSGEVAESDAIERYCSTMCRWEEKTAEEIARDGKDCGTHKITVKLNRLGIQHNGDDEYIDMMWQRDRIGIVQAQQHHVEMFE